MMDDPRSMATKRRSPVVDDSDVDQIVAMLTPKEGAKPSRLAAEQRADLAHDFALNYARLHGTTAAWARELARRVRRRFLWVKTG